MMKAQPPAPHQDFNPPHLPLTLTPRSQYEGIPLYNKGFPYISGLFGTLSGGFILTGDPILSGISALAGIGVYKLHTTLRDADRQICRIWHDITMTEDEITITGHDANGPRKHTAIKTAGLTTGIVYNQDETAAYVRLDTDDDGLIISTPLAPQEARQVAMMIYQAAQYTSTPYHLREAVKQQALQDFKLAFPELAETPDEPPLHAATPGISTL